MNNKNRHNDGLTLIEIIIAIAILAILVVSILGIFSGSFATIISMGNRTTALYEAQSIFNSFESKISNPATVDAINVELNSYVTVNSSDAELALTEDEFIAEFNDKRIRFYANTDVATLSIGGIQKAIDGFTLNIKVFYRNGTRNTVFTAFIPKG